MTVDTTHQLSENSIRQSTDQNYNSSKNALLNTDVLLWAIMQFYQIYQISFGKITKIGTLVLNKP